MVRWLWIGRSAGRCELMSFIMSRVSQFWANGLLYVVSRSAPSLSRILSVIIQSRVMSYSVPSYVERSRRVTSDNATFWSGLTDSGNSSRSMVRFNEGASWLSTKKSRMV